MKHTALINNVKSLEWGLTLAEAHVFSWIIDLPVWAEKIFIEGEVYYFASKTKAVDELPLITSKVDTMYRHYKSLESKGVIVLKKIDGKDYISFTPKSKEWVFNSESDGRKNFRNNSEKNPNQFGKKSDILNYNTIKSINDKVSSVATEKYEITENLAGLDSKDENSETEKSCAKKDKEFGKKEFRQTLIDLGINSQYVDDWISVRTSKKAVFTATALQLIFDECNKHNFPIEEAIKMCAGKGWQTFKYQWYLNENKDGTNKPVTAGQDRQQRIDGVKRMGSLARQIINDAISNASASDK